MTTRPRDVGILLFCGADALFYLACFFMYGFARAEARAWPDVPEAARIGATLPLLAAGALVLAALLHRARLHPFLAFGANAAALALIGFIWREASDRGLEASIDGAGVGRYGFVVWGMTFVWGVHVLACLVLTGIRISSARFAPFVDRFLALQAALGALLVGTVFLL